MIHIGMAYTLSGWWNQDTLSVILILTLIGYGYVNGALIIGTLVHYDFFSFITIGSNTSNHHHDDNDIDGGIVSQIHIQEQGKV